MSCALYRYFATTRRALYEAHLQQVWFVEILNRVRLVTRERRYGCQSDRIVAVMLENIPQQATIRRVEPELVNLKELQRFSGHHCIDNPIAVDISIITHAPQQPVGDARR